MLVLAFWRSNWWLSVYGSFLNNVPVSPTTSTEMICRFICWAFSDFLSMMIVCCATVKVNHTLFWVVCDLGLNDIGRLLLLFLCHLLAPHF